MTPPVSCEASGMIPSVGVTGVPDKPKFSMALSPPLDRDFALLDGLPGKRQNEDLRRACMREFMRTATRHWVSPLLFTLYWLVAMGLAVQQLLTGPGKISEINLALLILVPVLARALVVFLAGC